MMLFSAFINKLAISILRFCTQRLSNVLEARYCVPWLPSFWAFDQNQHTLTVDIHRYVPHSAFHHNSYRLARCVTAAGIAIYCPEYACAYKIEDDFQIIH